LSRLSGNTPKRHRMRYSRACLIFARWAGHAVQFLHSCAATFHPGPHLAGKFHRPARAARQTRAGVAGSPRRALQSHPRVAAPSVCGCPFQPAAPAGPCHASGLRSPTPGPSECGLRCLPAGGARARRARDLCRHLALQVPDHLIAPVDGFLHLPVESRNFTIRLAQQAVSDNQKCPRLPEGCPGRSGAAEREKIHGIRRRRIAHGPGNDFGPRLPRIPGSTPGSRPGPVAP